MIEVEYKAAFLREGAEQPIHKHVLIRVEPNERQQRLAMVALGTNDLALKVDCIEEIIAIHDVNAQHYPWVTMGEKQKRVGAIQPRGIRQVRP